MWTILLFGLLLASVAGCTFTALRQARRIRILERSKEELQVEETLVFDFLHGLGEAFTETIRPRDRAGSASRRSVWLKPLLRRARVGEAPRHCARHCVRDERFVALRKAKHGRARAGQRPDGRIIFAKRLCPRQIDFRTIGLRALQ